jgi:hypothetical protein
MDLRAIKGAQIKISATPSPKDKTELAFILHTIKKAKPMHILRRGVALPPPAFTDGRFVKLPIVSLDILHQVPRAICFGERMLANTTSIDQV